MDRNPNEEPMPDIDYQAQQRAQDRKQMLASGMLALPNLFLRSALTLTVLYGILGLVLITMVQFNVFSTTFAVVLGCFIIVIQYAIGPFLMDLSLRWLYTMRWVEPSEL